MDHLPQETLSKIWQRGLRLGDAWLGYAQPKNRDAWEAVKKTSKMDAFTEAATTAQGADPMQKMLHAFQTFQPRAVEETRLMDTMRKDILRFIEHEYLYAFGYEAPRQLASPIVPIPRGLWKGRVDWQTGTLTSGGMTFLEIRLTTRHITEETAAEPFGQPEAKRVGRPSLKAPVLRAVSALAAEGKIDPTKSATFHFPLIRAKLAATEADLPIPATRIQDETIRRIFSPFFNDLKHSKKQ